MGLSNKEGTSSCFSTFRLHVNRQQKSRPVNGQKIFRKVCAGKALTTEEASIYLQLFRDPRQLEPHARRDVGTGTSDKADLAHVHDEEMFRLLERGLQTTKNMLRQRVAEVVQHEEMHRNLEQKVKNFEVRYQDARHQLIYTQGKYHEMLQELSTKEKEIVSLKAELDRNNHELVKKLSIKEENDALKAELERNNHELLQKVFIKEENDALKAELERNNHELLQKVFIKEENDALKAELMALKQKYEDKYMNQLREQSNAIVTLKAENKQLREQASHLQEAYDVVKFELEERRLQIGVDDFNLLRVLGRGGYGKVLLVEQKMTKSLHAMKIIKKENVTREEIEIEKGVLNLAKDCPFLVAMEYSFETTTRFIFVMEYASGGDMFTHLQKQKQLPEEHVKFYTAEVVLGLHFLHEKGVAYRDLKLENILMDHEGHLKLADFGMCKNALQQGSRMKTFCGTPKSIAPEMVKGLEYGFSVDWWAVGIIIHELITGYSPFDRGLEYLTYEDIVYKDVELQEWISVEASALIFGFLIKDPDHRLGTNCKWGLRNIQSHLFFAGIQWDALARKEVQPPYKPHISSSQDVGNFDQQFTSEDARITPDNSVRPRQFLQENFNQN